MRFSLGSLIILAALCPTAYSSIEYAQDISHGETHDQVLDQLYRDAVAEGGNLVVYEGGDGKNQQLWTNIAFNTRFPGMNATLVVDLSKYHDINIDRQIAAGKLEVDVAHLQTVHDFYRWKDEGVLMPFKPPHWDQVYPELKDPDGHFTSTAIYAFAANTRKSEYDAGEGPIEDEDFLDPKYKNRIILTYPHDDDAVLYQFYKLQQNHGWNHIEKLFSQNITWVRGSETPVNMIRNGTISNGATFTSSNSQVQRPDDSVVIRYPKKSWFLSWGQNAAIFKNAPHPAAAKLFVAWRLSNSVQKSVVTAWPTRVDLPGPVGYRRLFEYPNTSPRDFIQFMLNRTLVEELKSTYERVIGPVLGDTPLNDPNL